MKISKEDFKNLYYKKRDAEIAEILGIKCVITVRNYARSLGLTLKGTGYMYPNDIRKMKKIEFI
jgi:hypothetical protein